MTFAQCSKNCSVIPYSSGFSDNSSLSCSCVSGFLWDQSIFQCYKDCSGVLDSTGERSLSNLSCICLPNFYWDSYFSLCAYDCSHVAHSLNIPLILYGNASECICVSGFTWNEATRECISICTAGCTQCVDGACLNCDYGYFSISNTCANCLVGCKGICSLLNISLCALCSAG
jgi:hypothetical protein